jgi:hypothetical protein
VFRFIQITYDLLMWMCLLNVRGSTLHRNELPINP